MAKAGPLALAPCAPRRARGRSGSVAVGLESPCPPSAPGSKALSGSNAEWGGWEGARTRHVCVQVCMYVWQGCAHEGMLVCQGAPVLRGKGNIVGAFFYVPKLPPSDSSCFSGLGRASPLQLIPIIPLQLRLGDAKGGRNIDKVVEIVVGGIVL